MKKIIKKSIHTISTWPIIGRLVHIVVGVTNIPTYHHRQHIFETEQLPSLLQAISELNHRQQANSELNHRQQAFQTEQLPTLLQTISELNHRFLEIDNDKNNLVKSVPVALRKITRDIVEIRRQLESLSKPIEDRIRTAEDQLKNTSKSMENRVDTAQVKLGNISNSVDYLLGRVEFVRRELMFEMRYGGNEPRLVNEKEQLETKVKILSSEKLEDATKNNQVRLNLGCGHIPLEGYLNVDRRELPGVDIVAEIDKLPFETSQVNEIFSAHLLEHFPQEQLRRELLPYYFGLLKTNGEFRAVVPDAEAMIREYTEGEYPYDHMREVFYGAQDYDGDFHYNMFTPDALEKLLKAAGFKEISIVESSRKNGNCFEFEIVAFKKVKK